MNEIIAIRCCVCVFYFLIFFLFHLHYSFCSVSLNCVCTCVYFCVLCILCTFFSFSFYILFACLNFAGWGLLFIVLDCFLIYLYGLYLDDVSQFWQCCRERDLKIKQKRTCSFFCDFVFLFLFFAKVYYLFCLLLCSVTALKSLGFCMFISSFFWYSVSV